MKNTNIVATYDYYTLEQAKHIIKQEETQKIRRKRKQIIESLKLTLVLFLGMGVFPMWMVLHWITYGY